MIELVSYPEQVEAGFQLGRLLYNKSLKAGPSGNS